jgi:hypothetical protein
MADHELEIKFTGDWSGLRTQAEREAAAIQSRFAGVGVGGGGGNAAAAGVPGASPAVQQAVSDAFSRIDARRNAVTAASVRTSRISDVELSPILRSARYELPEGGAEIVPLPAAAMGAGFGGGGVARGGGAFPGWGDRRGLQRMLAAEEGGDVAAGGAVGFGLRAGRLRGYATAGFVALEASRLARASQEYSETVALGGGSDLSRFQAERGWQQSISGFPLVGGFAELGANYFARGFGASSLQSSLTIAQAQSQDARTNLMRVDRRRLDDLNAAGAAAAAPNEFVRARLTTAAEGAAALSEAQTRRTTRGSAIGEDIGRLAASDAESRTARARERLFRLGVSATDQNVASAVEGLTQLDESARQAIQRTRVQQSEETFRVETQAISRLFDARRRSSVLGETAYDVNVAGEIRANVQRGTGDPFGAQLTEINAQNTANLTTAANPLQRVQESIKGASRLIEFFGTAGRELDRSIADAQARTGQNRALLSGNTLDAYRIGAERARDRAIEALPRNVFFDRLRSAITGETQSEVERATEEDRLSRAQVTGNLQLEADVTGLQADQRPTAARARAIAGRARLQSQQLRGPDAAGNRMLLYQRAINEERILENEIVYGGRASVSEAGTTGGRGAREDQAAYQTFDDPSAIRDEIKGLRQDFNSSLIGGFRAGTIY